MPIERERNELQFVLKDHSIHSHALTRRWNVAARIQALVDPGGIYISRGAAEQVRDKVPIKIETRGERTVKNIARPIEVFCIIAEGRDAIVKSMQKTETRVQTPMVADKPTIAFAPPPDADRVSHAITVRLPRR